ncbi:9217_t:CDS:1, partial [Funneliformis mosseae]
MNKEAISQSGREIYESKPDNDSDSNDSKEDLLNSSDDDKYGLEGT